MDNLNAVNVGCVPINSENKLESINEGSYFTGPELNLPILKAKKPPKKVKSVVILNLKAPQHVFSEQFLAWSQILEG